MSYAVLHVGLKKFRALLRWRQQVLVTRRFCGEFHVKESGTLIGAAHYSLPGSLGSVGQQFDMDSLVPTFKFTNTNGKNQNQSHIWFEKSKSTQENRPLADAENRQGPLTLLLPHDILVWLGCLGSGLKRLWLADSSL